MLYLIAWDKEKDIAVEPERAPNDGEWARFPNGVKKTWYAPVQQQNNIITIDAKVNDATFVNARIGDTINFTASFSDKTLNRESLSISIVDRLNGLIRNIGINVENGEGQGSLVVDQPIDYLVTNIGINRHKEEIPVQLVLLHELTVRVKE